MRPGDLEPMKMEFVEVDDAGPFVSDDGWVAEQKFDGTRVMARIGSGRIDFVGVGGIHITQSAAVQWFSHLREELSFFHQPDGYGDEWVFDGELLVANGTYVVYDFPLGHRGLMHPGRPFEDRRESLEALMASWPRDLMVLAPQARGVQEKMALLRRVCAAGEEGVVFKRLAAPYEPGVRVTHQLKAKLVRTADCVVLARDVGGKNAKLGMYEPMIDCTACGGRGHVTGEDPGDPEYFTDIPCPTCLGDGSSLRRIGGCSMIGKPDARPGDVVEVQYLYWTGEALYQPRMTRIREDKERGDCHVQQLSPAVTKAVLV